MVKEKFNSFLNDKILPNVMKIGQAKSISAIRDGFGAILPLIMAGSLFLIVINLPGLLGFENVMVTIFGGSWSEKLSYAVNATFNIMGLAASLSLAYFYAKENKIEPLAPAIANLSAYILTIPLTTEGDLPLGELGSLGLFVAIVLTFLTVHIFIFMEKHNISIKLPDSVPPAVSRSFSAMFPTIVTIISVLLIRLIVEQMGAESINSIINIILATPLKKAGGGYLGGLVYVLAVHGLWAIGIHGGNIANSVMSPIFLQ